MSSSDLDLYEGRVKMVRLDEDRLDELDSLLEEFLGDIESDEKLVVNIKQDVMMIRVLRS